MHLEENNEHNQLRHPNVIILSAQESGWFVSAHSTARFTAISPCRISWRQNLLTLFLPAMQAANLYDIHSYMVKPQSPPSDAKTYARVVYSKLWFECWGRINLIVFLHKNTFLVIPTSLHFSSLVLGNRKTKNLKWESFTAPFTANHREVNSQIQASLLAALLCYCFSIQ